MKGGKIVEIHSGILCIHNGLCVYNCSEKEHDANLFYFMQIASDNGLVFNIRKCQIKCSQITFCSTILNKLDMKLNIEEIQESTEMPPICTINAVISSHAKLNAAIHSMFVTLHSIN